MCSFRSFTDSFSAFRFTIFTHMHLCMFVQFHSRCLVISYLILVRQGAIFTFHAAFIKYFVKDPPQGPYNLPII